MSQSRDVVSNLQQSAQDIIDYLLTYRDEAERIKLQQQIDDIFSQARKEYAGDTSTTLGLFRKYFILPLTRHRRSELERAITLLRGCPEEQFARFVIIIDLLRAGGANKSTSLNTIILDKLIAATGKYNPINDDKRLDATSLMSNDARINVRDVLKSILVEKSVRLIVQHTEEKRREEEAKRAAKKVEQQPHRLAISQALIEELDQVLKGKRIKQKPQNEVHKLDKKMLAERNAMLQAALGKKEVVNKRQKIAEAAEKLRPLEVTFEETVVEVLRKPAPLSARKLSDNPSFAASLNTIGAFFAAKNHKTPEQLQQAREDNLENIANLVV